MPYTWRYRFKRWICEHFGHREREQSQGGVVCKRCDFLLRGPNDLDEVERLYEALSERAEVLERLFIDDQRLCDYAYRIGLEYEVDGWNQTAREDLIDRIVAMERVS